MHKVLPNHYPACFPAWQRAAPKGHLMHVPNYRSVCVYFPVIPVSHEVFLVEGSYNIYKRVLSLNAHLRT